MALTKVVRRSFAGGEITPEMFGRLDNVKNQTGLALCRNALVLPHGPATKRTGFGYVAPVHDSSAAVRAIPFVFNEDQSAVLEFGAGYIAFTVNGGALLEAVHAITYVGAVVTDTAHGYSVGNRLYIGGRFVQVSAVADVDHYTVVDVFTGLAPTLTGATAARCYRISSPYTAADLFSLRYAQDADVLTLTCPGYAPRELRRLGATNWALTAPALGGAITAPSAPTTSYTVGTGSAYPKDAYYKVTTVSDGQESLPSGASGAVPNDLTLPGSKNDMAWGDPGVAGATFRVYKALFGNDRMFGYIGETTGLTFTDDNIVPDYSRSPPSEALRVDTVGTYPAAVTYYEQRRVFAGGAQSQTITMTRSGTESDMNVSYPSQSGDAIQLRLKAQRQNGIRHLLPLGDLLALTAGSVWRVFANNDGALVPNTVAARIQSNDGANQVSPLVAGSAAIFVENTGKRVRDIAYSTEARGYVTDDRSIMAPHLFNDYTIVDGAFQRNPDKVAWFVRDDGAMLSMTYLPEQQVFAWAQHTTDGFFESVCVVPENNEDVLYAVVRRTLHGAAFRTIERMASRQFVTVADAFFLDCGLTYSGAPVASVSGLQHLEGLAVVVLADGGVEEATVTGGAVDLDVPASKISVGLRYTLDLQTLPFAIEGVAAAGQGTVKSISDVYPLVYRTGVFLAGRAEDDLHPVPMRTAEDYDSPPDLKSEELDELLSEGFDRHGQLWLRSRDPVPFTLAAITMKVHLAG
jgi:hypothetical protein